MQGPGFRLEREREGRERDGEREMERQRERVRKSGRVRGGGERERERGGGRGEREGERGQGAPQRWGREWSVGRRLARPAACSPATGEPSLLRKAQNICSTSVQIQQHESSRGILKNPPRVS